MRYGLVAMHSPAQLLAAPEDPLSWDASEVMPGKLALNLEEQKRPEPCQLRLNRLTEYFVGHNRLTL